MTSSTIWRYYGGTIWSILILMVVNTLFLVIFNLFSTDYFRYDVGGYRRPKPFFNSEFRRLIDLYDFRYVIDSDVCESSCTPILVHSHVGNFERRKVLRRSYPQTVLGRMGFRYVFMTGLPTDNSSQSILRRESKKHGDIVQGNFLEAYRNLTYKHVMGLTWFAERCRKSSHAVKMDDDVAVNMFKLKHIINREVFVLAGCVIRAKPIRDHHNKWYVSQAEYANDTYPPFLSGWIYVATATSITQLLRAIQRFETYFWIDDLYVTGILAERANISLTDLRQYFETDPGPLYCCVHKRQRCEFLVAPIGGNHTLLEQYAKQLINCKVTNMSCNAFQKSKHHHLCLDLWKNSMINIRTGRPLIEILN